MEIKNKSTTLLISESAYHCRLYIYEHPGEVAWTGYPNAMFSELFYISNLSNIFIKMKGTTYGNRLPRGTQVRKRLETTVLGDKSDKSVTK
jgi:hypothetical protein